MTRSQEALERRAKKRNLPLAIQKKKDNPFESSRKLNSDKIPPKNSEMEISLKEWICRFCSNSNFAARSTCNRCMKSKLESDTPPPPPPPPKTLPSNPVPPKTLSAKPPPQNKPAPKALQMTKFTSKQTELRSWSISQAKPEEIERNAKLRELYQQEITSGVTSDELTAEERERAKILLARSTRKKESKEKLEKWKKIKQEKKKKTKSMPAINSTNPLKSEVDKTINCQETPPSDPFQNEKRERSEKDDDNTIEEEKGKMKNKKAKKEKKEKKEKTEKEK